MNIHFRRVSPAVKTVIAVSVLLLIGIGFSCVVGFLLEKPSTDEVVQVAKSEAVTAH